MIFDLKNILNSNKEFRINLINSITGIKPANVIGSESKLGISNLYPNSIYVPSSNDWMETTINLNSLISENSLMIKIEMFSGGGNNVYIDNLNLSYSINKTELLPKRVVQVYPSPSCNNARIKTNSPGKILILNAIGVIIYSYDSKAEPIIIDELSSGLHYVIFTDNNGEKYRVSWVNTN